MNRIFVSVLAGMILLSCKKNDLPVAQIEEQALASKPANTGNIKTRILNNSLHFPWEILWGPDNYIWFTEKDGHVKRMNPQTGAVIHVATIPDAVATTRFSGLLGMVLDPNWSSNPFVYVVYNYFDSEGDYMQKIVRFRYNGTTLVEPLILVDGIVGKDGGDFIHNGSRLAIGPDGKLYATTGDANLRFELPQNPTKLNGKVLRVNLNGSIPADNPYGNPVWAIGFRNSQGLVYAMGRWYSSEHGETTDDEINIIERNRNYGWPFVEGFCDRPDEQSFCSANNVKEPIFAWTPTVAPSGMDFYDKNEIPQWRRSLLVTFLKNRRLRQMKLNGDGTAIEEVHEFFINQFGRLRDVAISPDGKVYICTDNGNNQDMIIEVSRGSGM